MVDDVENPDHPGARPIADRLPVLSLDEDLDSECEGERVDLLAV